MAVVIALAHERKDTDMSRRQNSTKFKEEVHKLSVATGIYKGPCGLPEIKIVEDYLQDYQIMVFDKDLKLNKLPIYLNTSRKFEKFIYLCLHENHYYVVTKMNVFLGTRMYCNNCKVGYYLTGEH